MIKITPDTRPKEKAQILNAAHGKKVKIAAIGKEDAYFQYDLLNIEGVVHLDDLYRICFRCDTDLEAHGIRANIRVIYFTDVEFEIIN